MRFLFLTQYFPPEIGAPQIRLAALIRMLRRRGHEVEVVTALPHHLTGKIYAQYHGKFYVDDIFEDSVVRRTWAYAATGVGFKRLLNYASFTLTSFLGLARSKRPDYLFVESPPLFLGITGAIFSFIRRAPMIFNVADLWPDSVRQLGVLKNDILLSVAEYLEHWIYKRSRFINATTLGIKADLIQKKRQCESKVLFLPNGVDTSLFVPLVPDSALERSLKPNGEQLFIYAGTHGFAQGLETVIDAAAMLQGSKIVILFIGDGPTKQRLVMKATELGLNNVLFHSMQPVEEMPKFFSLATASIVPLIKNELFKGARPSKILSSLAAGVPVIFCGEGESADLLTEHRAGLVVEPENAVALANAIRVLSDDAALRSQLAANGRRLVRDQFNWDSIVDGWLRQLLTADGRASGA